MPWFFKFFEQFKMDKAGDPPPGGGSGGGNAPSVADLQAKLDALQKENDSLKANPPKTPPTPPEDPSLAEKAKQKAADDLKSAEQTKKLEAAIHFSYGAKDWMKLNKAFLPETIPSIFELAEKDRYDSPIEKDAVIKMNLVTEFFSVQKNVDVLTQAQKSKLEDYLKLTKNVKQERAQSIYETVFEPTLEMLKQIEKARQVNSGTKNQTDGEKALADRMMKLSKKHYLGDKENA